MLLQPLQVQCVSLTLRQAQVPGLAVVLVGTRGDSETYVRSKRKACEEVGIRSFAADLPEDVKEDDLLKVGLAGVPVWIAPVLATCLACRHLPLHNRLLQAPQPLKA